MHPVAQTAVTTAPPALGVSLLIWVLGTRGIPVPADVAVDAVSLAAISGHALGMWVVWFLNRKADPPPLPAPAALTGVAPNA